MVQKLIHFPETPSQTAGPYVHIGLTPNLLGNHGIYETDLGVSPIKPDAQGERITITGSVYDGAGMILRDALLESWQADATGRYPGSGRADPYVTGWCRFAADFDSGQWTLSTIKPGAVGPMPPHIAIWIVARGINVGLNTRIYFDDEDNTACPVLARIEDRSRIPTLVACRTAPGTYHFDIRLQGEDETVFFEM